MDESTVLEYLQAADLVSDSLLMNECLRLWGQPDFKYVSHSCSAFWGCIAASACALRKYLILTCGLSAVPKSLRRQKWLP